MDAPPIIEHKSNATDSSAVISSDMADSASSTKINSGAEPNHSITEVASVTEADHSTTEAASKTDLENSTSVNEPEQSVTEAASKDGSEPSISGNTQTISSEVSEPSQKPMTDNGNETHTVTEGGEVTNDAQKIEGEEMEVNPAGEGSDGETSGEEGLTE